MAISPSGQFYTVNHKKRDILFLTITLANLNQFLQFLYHFYREEILHVAVIKFITSPDLCAHVCRPVSTLKADILNITYDCYSQNNNVEMAAV